MASPAARCLLPPERRQPTPSEEGQSGDAADHDADARDLDPEQDPMSLREDEQKRPVTASTAAAMPSTDLFHCAARDLSQPAGNSLSVSLLSLPSKANGVW